MALKHFQKYFHLQKYMEKNIVHLLSKNLTSIYVLSNFQYVANYTSKVLNLTFYDDDQHYFISFSTRLVYEKL